MKVQLLLLSVLLPITSLHGMKFLGGNKSSTTAVSKGIKQPTDLHRQINQLINTIEQLKKENANLKAGKGADTLKVVDYSKDLDAVADILKSVDQQQEESSTEVDELKKQVEYLGNGWLNTIKTFEANINAPTFSKFLSANIEQLDNKSIAQKINEEIANIIYRLKFMYTEMNYLFNWINVRINWPVASKKGIFIPNFTKNFTDDQIKNMVMAVKVQ